MDFSLPLLQHLSISLVCQFYQKSSEVQDSYTFIYSNIFESRHSVYFYFCAFEAWLSWASNERIVGQAADAMAKALE